MFGHWDETFAGDQGLTAEPVPAARAEERKKNAAHGRRTARIDGAESGEDLKFFDGSKVPVQTITSLNADLQGVPEYQYEVIARRHE